MFFQGIAKKNNFLQVKNRVIQSFSKIMQQISRIPNQRDLFDFVVYIV
jgi:hypothetical protein